MEKPPGFIQFPPVSIRLQIGPEEWEACVAAWITLAEANLRLPALDFQSSVADDDSGVIEFLTSYLHEHSDSTSPGSLLNTPRAKTLHRLVYLLCHRLLSSERIPPVALEWIFLAEISQVYHSSSSLPGLLKGVWIKRSPLIESSLQKIKESLIKDLDIGNQDSCEPIIRKLDHLLHLIPAVGFFFAVGSDLVDSLAIAFVKVSSKAQQTFTLFVYLSLVSLVRLPSPNFSLLSDHLYSLKTNARALKAQNRPSLLASVVSNTPFIQRLEKMSISSSDSETSEFPKPPRDLSAGLLEFNSSRTRPVHGRSKAGKGKARQAANEALDVVHIHRMSKISQVQDLFPDLGSGFITKLLDEYDEDVEIVTAHLLEDSLPEHLVNLDRSEQLQIQGHDNFENPHHTTAVFSPRSTPPLPERRNVFDNDEFDNLAVDASKLHIGKARQDLTADHLLSSSRTDKAAILAALARFDSDDDERDDTYDAADVGGTVDNSLDTDRDAAAAEDLAERRLFQTWKANPACFERDATTRKSQARAALKRETKWTDEAIEGWAIMLQREPVRVKNLERRLGEWRGEQQSISRSGWTEHATDDSGAEGELPARGGGYHGRGRGARGTAAGGGAGSERGTQRARRGKEVRGSHNRREGRAKKMARGMA